GLDHQPYLPAVHVAVFADLFICGADGVARNRESESFATPGLRQDERIDPYDAPIDIYQRTAAVSGIDRRVRLDIYGRVLGMKAAQSRADDSSAGRAFQSKRVSECHHELSLLKRVGIAQVEMGQSRAVDF